MSRSLAALVGGLVVVAACADDPVAPSGTTPTPSFNQGREAPLHAAAKGRIAGEYIVVLNDGVNPDSVVAATGKTPQHIYRVALSGFAVALSQGELQQLRRDERVKYISENAAVAAAGSEGSGPVGAAAASAAASLSATGRGESSTLAWPQLSTQSVQTTPAGLWGLDRLDGPFDTNGSYYYTDTGAGVNVYVIGTGGYFAHNDFDGLATNRLVKAIDIANPGGTAADCSDGYGTQMAGIIGGTTHGVAKGVKLWAVKISTSCTTSVTAANIIAAADWLTFNAKRPAVIHYGYISVGGNQAIDDAITRSISYGLTWIVPADGDACTETPGRVPLAITVGRSTNTDGYSRGFGSCVDLFAPGDALVPTIGSPTATTTASGYYATGAAHVAGIAALFLKAKTTATPGEVAAAIRNGAVLDQLGSLPASTVNRLAGTQLGYCTSAGVNCFNTDGQTSFPDQASPTSVGGAYGFYLSGPGVQRIWLRGTPGTNFNLYYDEWNGSSWVQKAKKETTSTNEFLQYTSTCGGATTCYKRARVQSLLGTGTFNLWFDWQ